MLKVGTDSAQKYSKLVMKAVNFPPRFLTSIILQMTKRRREKMKNAVCIEGKKGFHDLLFR